MNAYKKSSILIATLLLFVGVACNRNEEPYFSYHSADNFVLAPRDTAITIKVESNTAWALTSNTAWCVPQITAGTGSSEVAVAVAENDEQGERETILTLDCADAAYVKHIKVTQQRLTPDATTAYRLPVVFHVLYKSSTNKQQNVVKGHLATLIDAVNEVYAHCGEELGLEFVMATHDPEGNLLEEPGVDRQQIKQEKLNSSSFMRSEKNNQYMWDPNRYINIFLYTFEDAGILGISHFPYVIKPHSMEGCEELEHDADWNELPWPQCVSINNEYIYSHEAYYTITDVVNTLAHELGHFLGLRHAFSEDPVTYDRNTCMDSDFCTDTPTYNKAAYDKLMQAYMTSGGIIDKEEEKLLMMREDCETGEEFRSTNIMDYAYSEANRFTPQQAARIRYVLEHSPYIPGPKIRLPEQQVPMTKSAKMNQYVLKTFE